MQITLLKQSKFPYHLATFAILAGIGLTAFSMLGLCTSSCSQTHNYRLLGMPFELSGAFFFGSLAIAHFYAFRHPQAKLLAEALIAMGLGAEIFFILLQKIQIGAWCPVCLSIASTIALAAIAYYLMYRKPLPKGVFMKNWLHAGMISTMITLGFVISLVGVSKVDTLGAIETDVKGKIKFGASNASTEIYIFTDWACPACRKVEPVLENFIPKILSTTKVTFVETVVHPETLNYAPYDLSFMVHDKARYFKIREALTQLALKVPEPNDEDIQAAVAPLGVKLRELPYQDVMAAMNYFEDLIKKYKVNATPTVVVVGSGGKTKTLTGSGINEAGLREAISSVK